MPRRANVKVVSESSTGLNKRILINGQIYTNTQAYNAAKQGKVEGYHGVNDHEQSSFVVIQIKAKIII